MLKESTCRFYTGSQNTHCEAGVAYRDVTIDPDEPGSAYRKPCIDWEMWYKQEKMGDTKMREAIRENLKRCGTCDKREAPTAEEAAASEAESDRRFKEHMDKIKNNICPTHNIPIVKKQVGRCVYAEPCGCRLYQGTIPKE